MLDDAVLAALDRAHVDADLACREAEFAAAARDMRSARARHQRLGGNAAVVHAGAAEQLALDERGLQTLLVEPRAQRRPRLAGSDHDRVELFCHG